MANNVLVNLEDGLLSITIDRSSKHNALSIGVLDELHKIFQSYTSEPAVKVAVITGAGSKSFCAGGDLFDCDNYRSDAKAKEFCGHGKASLDSIRYFPVPTIAAINGLALGGGAELALANDFLIAATTAKIGFIHRQLNITAAWGGNIDLIERVGATQALRLMINGKLSSTQEAHEIGLIDEYPARNGSLEDCVKEFLLPLLDLSPQLLRAFKAPIAQRRRRAHESYGAVAKDWAEKTWGHPDHWEAHDTRLKNLK